MLVSLKDILNPDILISINNSNTDNNFLKIKESAKDSKIEELTIYYLPQDVVAFTLDHQPKRNSTFFQQLSCYVNKSEPGINKGCDLILVWIKDNKLHALVFDLKSDKPRKEDTQTQLNNSELFLRYLLNLVKLHKDKNIDGLNIKKAIVRTTERVTKTVTYQRNNDKNYFEFYVEGQKKQSVSFKELI